MLSTSGLNISSLAVLLAIPRLAFGRLPVAGLSFCRPRTRYITIVLGLRLGDTRWSRQGVASY